MVDHDAGRRLVGVIQQLSLARDLASVTAIVRTAARQLTGADGASFVLRDQGRCYYVDEDAISPLWKGQRFPMEACISGWSMLHRECVAIPDIYADPRIPQDAYRPTFVKSLVMVPIRTADPVGAIGIYWATHHVATPEEIELLSTLANSTSIALENLQLLAQLEQRVEERTADLVRVQRHKQELVELIVHDLRSPANGIMLASQARLRDRKATQTDVERWRRINASAAAIHRMATNMLDVMRSEDGQFAPKPECVDAGALVAEVADQVRPIADGMERSLACELDALPTVTCDAEMIRRVLQNLVDNALRFTPGGGCVTLRARHIGDAIEIRVADEGPGIPGSACSRKALVSTRPPATTQAAVWASRSASSRSGPTAARSRSRRTHRPEPCSWCGCRSSRPNERRERGDSSRSFTDVAIHRRLHHLPGGDGPRRIEVARIGQPGELAVQRLGREVGELQRDLAQCGQVAGRTCVIAGETETADLVPCVDRGARRRTHDVRRFDACPVPGRPEVDHARPARTPGRARYARSRSRAADLTASSVRPTNQK